MPFKPITLIFFKTTGVVANDTYLTVLRNDLLYFIHSMQSVATLWLKIK